MANRRNQSIVEDCLKAVYAVGEWDARGRSVSEIAAQTGASTSTTSALVRRLSEEGWLSHEPYGDVALTPRGAEVALRMVRRHRLIETFLVEQLQYRWDEVHDEAEALEHTVSDLMVDRIDEALGRPWRDPHGDAVPTADGVVHLPPARPLIDLAPGETGFVARLLDESPEMLRWFEGEGLALDVAVRTVESSPFAGTVVVELPAVEPAAPRQVHVGPQAAGAVWVTPQPPWTEPNDAGCRYPHCRHPSWEL